MGPNPRDVFLRLVHGVADGRFEEPPGLYAEVTDVRHPMAMPEAEPLRSRDALARHLTVPPGASIPERRVVDVAVHQTADPGVIVAEFGYEFSEPDGGVTTVPCVFVMRVRDGQIVESRDYIDPVRAARAHGRIDGLIAALRRPRPSGGCRRHPGGRNA
jgi:ketosteroid isomerase-like protein